MNQDNRPFEDEAIQAAMAEFGMENTTDEIDADGPLAREYRELLGLMALAAPPIAASTDLKERIMTELLGEETQEVEHLVQKVREYSQDANLETRVIPIMVPESTGSAASGQWLRWAAAAMLFGLVALGSVSVYLFREVDTMGNRLANLTLEMDDAASSREGHLAQTRSVLADTKQNLMLVTSSSTEICPLRAPGGSAVPTARGILYIAPDHQHWYLRVQGLKQIEENQYRLWFLVGDGLKPVNGGSLDLQGGREATLGSATMPENTKAVKITLEDRDAEGDPEGPVVVFGDDMLRIL